VATTRFSPAFGAWPIVVIGHQWYWEYQSPENALDSFREGHIKDRARMRLLETDHMLILPSYSVTLYVTSQDVLHSWAVPSLGVKMDACPGRLNYSHIMLKDFHFQQYFGQCSEICGANHRFMPISLCYNNWISHN
jgi:heme/copper-type cytochrome/quinol oxidase subunit 2